MAGFGSQVGLEHYDSRSYDTIERFISYHVQKELILNACRGRNGPKVLEIGTGTGFLASYLRAQGIDLVTFDFDERLDPDITGDIRELDALVNESYDVVACFEVLEHMPYEDVPGVIRGIRRITREVCLLSVPQLRLYVSLWLKLPRIAPLEKYMSLPFAKRHRFDGQHYWELGCRGYSLKKFKDLLSEHFAIESDFTTPLSPYHRFFALRTMD